MGDEPTGNLEKKWRHGFIFKTLTQEFNQTILIVTHDIDFASKTDRIITMEDGRVIS
jgi:lipoprotein-releasing system ATP-binding protein